MKVVKSRSGVIVGALPIHLFRRFCITEDDTATMLSLKPSADQNVENADTAAQ